MIEWIKNESHLGQVQEKHKDFLMLIFYADFSSTAKRARTELEKFSQENKEVPVYGIDVEKVKGIHKQFGVENVPTVVAVKKGKVSLRIEGVESAQLYYRILSETNSLPSKGGKKGASHRVIVYSGSGCPACGTAKAYTTTSPFGNFELPSHIPQLAEASGAVYVARWTALHTRRLTKSIIEAFQKPGFSVVEVVSPCAMYYSRINKLGEGIDMMQFYHKNSIIKHGEPTENLDIQYQKEIIVGKFVDRERPTFIESYNCWIAEAKS